MIDHFRLNLDSKSISFMNGFLVTHKKQKVDDEDHQNAYVREKPALSISDVVSCVKICIPYHTVIWLFYHSSILDCSHTTMDWK